MKVIDNQALYDKLRQEYPWFSYDSFEIYTNKNSIDFYFVFNISNKYIFKPTYNIPFTKAVDINKLKEADFIQNIIFHIGLIELISYWKVTCSPIIYIKPKYMFEEQIKWWKKLYYNGLGEFFWHNNIKVQIDEFVEITITGDKPFIHSINKTYDDNKVLVSVGGGKDSVVTLELLKNKFSLIPFAINPRLSTIETVKTAGFNDNDIFIFNREIDKRLLWLNDKGFLNGHTPFSALLAFNSLLAAYLIDAKHIALSNESSANEPTDHNTMVNHQYSKSFEFEKDFREYVKKYIISDLNYFSFLRPLSEIQIAKIFSKYKKQYFAFKSCNAGSKNNLWCCACPKCLFTWIILSPFISQEVLEKIFGQDLLNNINLIEELNKLTGITPVKPFECVGTIEEVNIALKTLLHDDRFSNKALIRHYKQYNDYYKIYKDISEYNFLDINKEHFLPDDFKIILIDYLRLINNDTIN